jgi:hypothetical protein
MAYCPLEDSDSPVFSGWLYSNPMSDNPGEFSVDVLKRDVSEGNCQDGRDGSAVG